MGHSQSIETDDSIIGKSVLINNQEKGNSNKSRSSFIAKKAINFRPHRAVITKEFSAIALSREDTLSPKTHATHPETPSSLATNPDLVSMITPTSTTNFIAIEDNTNINNTTLKHQEALSQSHGDEIRVSTPLHSHFTPFQETDEDGSTSSDDLDCNDDHYIKGSLRGRNVNECYGKPKFRLGEKSFQPLNQQRINTRDLDKLASTKSLSMQYDYPPAVTKSCLEVSPGNKNYFNKSSLEKHILADFKKLRVEVQLKEYQEEKGRRQAKYDERYADVKAHQQLYKEFEELQVKSTSHQKELDKMESSRRRSRSLDLRKSNSWYFDFESLDAQQQHFDVGEDQSKYSLFSPTYMENQIRYFAVKKQKEIARRKSDCSVKSFGNLNCLLGGIVKENSESLKKYFLASPKKTDYGPVNRRFQSTEGEDCLQAHHSPETTSDYGPNNLSTQSNKERKKSLPFEVSANSMIGTTNKLSTVPLQVGRKDTDQAKDEHDSSGAKRNNYESKNALYLNNMIGNTYPHTTATIQERKDNIAPEEVKAFEETQNAHGNNCDPRDSHARLIQVAEYNELDDEKFKREKSLNKRNLSLTEIEESLTSLSMDKENVYQYETSSSNSLAVGHKTAEKETPKTSKTMIFSDEDERDYTIASMSTDQFLHIAE